MSEKTRLAKLYNGIRQLEQYYLASDVPVKVVNDNSGDKKFVTREIPGDYKVLKEFCEIHESVQTVGYLMKNADALEKSDIRAVVVPFSSDFSYSPTNAKKLISGNISAKSKEMKGYGLPVKGKFNWTVADDLSTGTSNEGATGAPLHVVLVCHPGISPSVSNTDISTVLMNGIPTVELSKASAYLNIEFLSSDKTIKETTNLRGITTSNYLLSGAPDTRREKFKDFIVAEFASSGEVNQNDMSYETYAGMDVFTSPQTMIPPDIFDSNKKFVDPLRPFMSIEGFSLSIQSPQYGLDQAAASVTSNIELTLHDRKRLKDISDLVRPGGFQYGNLIKVTYGWAHPDARIISQKSAAQKFSTAYGDILDGCRVSEILSVVSSDFDMTDSGEIKIRLKAFSLGVNSSLDSLELSMAYQDGGASISELERELSKIQSKISKLSGKQFEKITTPSILTSGGTLGGKKLNWTKTNEIKQYRKKILKAGNTKELKDFTKSIDALIGDLFESKDNKLDKAYENRSSYITKLIDYLESSPDPFLTPTAKGFMGTTKLTESEIQGKADEADRAFFKKKKIKCKFISLGKLLTVILGTPLRKAYDGVDEIQMIFYGFNESAGAVQDLNIASMPLLFNDVKKLIKSNYEKKSAMSLKYFLNIVVESFVSDQQCQAYGISGKGVSNSETALEQLYGVDKGLPTEFVCPDLGVLTRVVPASDGTEDASKAVLRVEIYDKRAGSGSTYERLAKSATETGVFYSLKRQTQDLPTSMRHESNAKNAESSIKDFLSSFTADDFPKPDTEDQKKIIERIIKSSQKINLDTENIGFVLRSAYPTLVYGSSATGITSAKVASITDDRSVELALARQNTKLSALKYEDDPGYQELVSEVYPVKCSLQTIGNPFFNFSQIYYIDFGTGTSIDNTYIITGVSHKIASGEFSSNVELMQLGTYPVLVTPTNSIRKIYESIASSSKKK